VSVNALDVVNEVLVQAGYGVVNNSLVGADDTHGNKAYRCVQRAVNAITIFSRNWGWNEPLTTIPIVLNDENPDLPTTVNPHYIGILMITGTDVKRKVMTRTTFERFHRDILPSVDPDAVAEPRRWYILDNKLFIHPKSDGDFTLTLFAQGLPQTWDAIDSEATELNIDDTMKELLISTALWRYLFIKKDPDWKTWFDLAENPKNKQSMLRQVIIGNKLLENQALRRIRYARQSTPRAHI